MIDVRQIRANPDALREAIRLRRVDPALADVDRWLQLDEDRRGLQAEIDQLNTQKKELARLGKTDPDAARQKGQELREKGRELESRLGELSGAWQEVMDWFPNWPHPDMPQGEGEADNEEAGACVP